MAYSKRAINSALGTYCNITFKGNETHIGWLVKACGISKDYKYKYALLTLEDIVINFDKSAVEKLYSNKTLIPKRKVLCKS